MLEISERDWRQGMVLEQGKLELIFKKNLNIII